MSDLPYFFAHQVGFFSDGICCQLGLVESQPPRHNQNPICKTLIVLVTVSPTSAPKCSKTGAFKQRQAVACMHTHTHKQPLSTLILELPLIWAARGLGQRFPQQPAAEEGSQSLSWREESVCMMFVCARAICEYVHAQANLNICVCVCERC